MGKKILTSLILGLYCILPLLARSAAETDSLYSSIVQLEDAARVDRTNRDFYQLYSTDFKLAERLATEALAICREHQWELKAAETLKNLGIVKYLQGNYEEALAAYQEALEIFSRLEDPGGQCRVCNELGVFFSRREEYDRSISFLEQAARFCLATPDSIGWSNALDNRGMVHLKRGELETAEQLFREVVKLRKSLGDTLGLTYVYNNLAAVATEKENVEEGIRYLQLSTALREQLNDRQGVAVNINNIGEIHLAAGKPDQAIPYFRQSLRQSSALKFKDLERHTMEMLAQAYEQTGDYAQALHWKNRSYQLKDSLFNLERSAQIAEMQEKYETEKKEKELSQQKLVLRKRNMALLLTSLGVFSLGIILFLVVRQYRLRQQQLRREASLRENLLLQEGENRLQQERLRISRDLHDHLGAELSLIRSGIARQLFNPQKPVDRSGLETVNRNAKKAMEELRETIWAIRGEGGSVRDLAEKLIDFSGRFENTRLDLILADPVSELSISPGQSLALYRIFQEAIHNSVKYAPEALLQLKFDRNAEMLRITFSDDGPGFNSGIPSEGYGLGNMRERAEEISASFELDSGPEGTTIVLEMPLTA
jgi:signal transduction histidine kinase/Flp pilus assembly protein TadD